MSRRLVGIKEIAYYTIWADQTFRKKHLPLMVKARAVFKSKIPYLCRDGKTRRFWQYWTTEDLLNRYLISLADKNDGRI